MKLKQKCMIAFGLACGLFAANENKATAQTDPTYNIGTYFNIHHQENRLGAGVFTGPVFTPATNKVSFEFNAYAGYTLTGAQSPVRLRLGAVAGVATDGKNVFEYASPTVRIAPQIKNEKLSLLNNFYLVSSLSLKKDPALYLGFSIPLKGKHMKNTGLLVEGQRYP